MGISVQSFEIAAVVGMNMAVQEKLGLVFFHQRAEDGKATVGQVFHIIDMIGGRMGDEYIEAFVLP